MKVKDLISALQQLPQDLVVKVSDYDWDSGPEYNPPIIWVEIDKAELESGEVHLV